MKKKIQNFFTPYHPADPATLPPNTKHQKDLIANQEPWWKITLAQTGFTEEYLKTLEEKASREALSEKEKAIYHNSDIQDIMSGMKAAEAREAAGEAEARGEGAGTGAGGPSSEVRPTTGSPARTPGKDGPTIG